MFCQKKKARGGGNISPKNLMPGQKSDPKIPNARARTSVPNLSRESKEGTLEEKWRHCYVPGRPGLCGGMDREKRQKTCGDCCNNHQSNISSSDDFKKEK